MSDNTEYKISMHRRGFLRTASVGSTAFVMGCAIEPDSSSRTDVQRVRQAATVPGQPCFLNVKDYGAVGDGVTPDGPAIQAAINAGDVCFPPGVYLVNGVLTIPSHRRLSGLGGQTVLLRAQLKPHMPAADRVEDIVISDLWLNGNGAAYANVFIVDAHEVTLQHVRSFGTHYEGVTIGSSSGHETSQIKILNCRFTDLGYSGVTVAEASDVHLEGCFFDVGTSQIPTPTYRGVFAQSYLDSGIKNLTIRDCYFDGMHVHVANGDNVNLTGNRFTNPNSASYGIYALRTKDLSIRYNTFSGLTSADVVDAAIVVRDSGGYLEDLGRVHIDSNIIDCFASGYGVTVWTSVENQVMDQIIISGNVVRFDNRVGTYTRGVSVLGQTRDVVISSNVIENAAWAGIYCVGIDHANVIANVINDCGDAGVLIGGNFAHHIVANNTVHYETPSGKTGVLCAGTGDVFVHGGDMSSTATAVVTVGGNVVLTKRDVLGPAGVEDT